MAVAVADATGVVPNSSAGYPIATGQATQAPACPPTSTLLLPTQGGCNDTPEGTTPSPLTTNCNPAIPVPAPDPAALEVKATFAIQLNAKKFNLALDFFYGSQQSLNAEYGRNRAASQRCQILSSTSTNRVTLLQGNFAQLGFTKAGTSGGITTYTADANAGILCTLSYDGTHFTQFLPAGMQLKYQAQVAGGNPATHQLVHVADPSGVCHTYTYSSGAEAGLLKSITVPGGRLVTFTYASSTGTSLLSSVQDWSGRYWTFQYDASRNLTTLMTPIGCTTKYAYESTSPYRLAAMEDSNGYVSSYSYSTSQVVLQAGSSYWTWVYDNTGLGDPYTKVTFPSGAVLTLSFNGDGLVSSTNHPAGYSATLTYSNLVKVKEQIPAGVLCSLSYHSTFWVPTLLMDALGNRTTLSYDGYGNLTTLTDGLGSVTTYGYEGSGSTRLRIRQSDALGRVTSWSYDGEGQLSIRAKVLWYRCAAVDWVHERFQVRLALE